MDTAISCVEISVCCNTEWNKIRVEGRNRYCVLYTISIHLQDLSQVYYGVNGQGIRFFPMNIAKFIWAAFS